MRKTLAFFLAVLMLLSLAPNVLAVGQTVANTFASGDKVFNEVKFTTGEDVADGTYVILYQAGSNYHTLSNKSYTNLSGVLSGLKASTHADLSSSKPQFTGSAGEYSTTNPDLMYQWTIKNKDGKYTIQDSESKYLTSVSNGNNGTTLGLDAEEALWTVDTYKSTVTALKLTTGSSSGSYLTAASNSKTYNLSASAVQIRLLKLQEDEQGEETVEEDKTPVKGTFEKVELTDDLLDGQYIFGVKKDDKVYAMGGTPSGSGFLLVTEITPDESGNLIDPPGNTVYTLNHVENDGDNKTFTLGNKSGVLTVAKESQNPGALRFNSDASDKSYIKVETSDTTKDLKFINAEDYQTGLQQKFSWLNYTPTEESSGIPKNFWCSTEPTGDISVYKLKVEDPGETGDKVFKKVDFTDTLANGTYIIAVNDKNAIYAMGNEATQEGDALVPVKIVDGEAPDTLKNPDAKTQYQLENIDGDPASLYLKNGTKVLTASDGSLTLAESATDNSKLTIEKYSSYSYNSFKFVNGGMYSWLAYNTYDGVSFTVNGIPTPLILYKLDEGTEPEQFNGFPTEEHPAELEVGDWCIFTAPDGNETWLLSSDYDPETKTFSGVSATVNDKNQIVEDEKNHPGYWEVQLSSGLSPVIPMSDPAVVPPTVFVLYNPYAEGYLNVKDGICKDKDSATTFTYEAGVDGANATLHSTDEPNQYLCFDTNSNSFSFKAKADTALPEGSAINVCTWAGKEDPDVTPKQPEPQEPTGEEFKPVAFTEEINGGTYVITNKGGETLYGMSNVHPNLGVEDKTHLNGVKLELSETGSVFTNDETVEWKIFKYTVQGNSQYTLKNVKSGLYLSASEKTLDFTEDEFYWTITSVLDGKFFAFLPSKNYMVLNFFDEQQNTFGLSAGTQAKELGLYYIPEEEEHPTPSTGKTYQKVTLGETLQAGNYIVTYEKDGKNYAMTNEEGKAKFEPAKQDVDVDVMLSKEVTVDKDIINIEDDTVVWTIATDETGKAVTFKNGDEYLNAKLTDKTYLPSLTLEKDPMTWRYELKNEGKTYGFDNGGNLNLTVYNEENGQVVFGLYNSVPATLNLYKEVTEEKPVEKTYQKVTLGDKLEAGNYIVVFSEDGANYAMTNEAGEAATYPGDPAQKNVKVLNSQKVDVAENNIIKTADANIVWTIDTKDGKAVTIKNGDNFLTSKSVEETEAAPELILGTESANWTYGLYDVAEETKVYGFDNGNGFKLSVYHEGEKNDEIFFGVNDKDAPQFDLYMEVTEDEPAKPVEETFEPVDFTENLEGGTYVITRESGEDVFAMSCENPNAETLSRLNGVKVTLNEGKVVTDNSNIKWQISKVTTKGEVEYWVQSVGKDNQYLAFDKTNNLNFVFKTEEQGGKDAKWTVEKNEKGVVAFIAPTTNQLVNALGFYTTGDYANTFGLSALGSAVEFKLYKANGEVTPPVEETKTFTKTTFGEKLENGTYVIADPTSAFAMDLAFAPNDKEEVNDARLLGTAITVKEDKLETSVKDIQWAIESATDNNVTQYTIKNVKTGEFLNYVDGKFAYSEKDKPVYWTIINVAANADDKKAGDLFAFVPPTAKDAQVKVLSFFDKDATEFKNTFGIEDQNKAVQLVLYKEGGEVTPPVEETTTFEKTTFGATLENGTYVIADPTSAFAMNCEAAANTEEEKATDTRLVGTSVTVKEDKLETSEKAIQWAINSVVENNVTKYSIKNVKTDEYLDYKDGKFTYSDKDPVYWTIINVAANADDKKAGDLFAFVPPTAKDATDTQVKVLSFFGDKDAEFKNTFGIDDQNNAVQLVLYKEHVEPVKPEGDAFKQVDFKAEAGALADGSYLIVNDGDAEDRAMSNVANTNAMSSVVVTIDKTNVVTTKDATITWLIRNVKDKDGKATAGYTIYNETAKKFLAANKDNTGLTLSDEAYTWYAVSNSDNKTVAFSVADNANKADEVAPMLSFDAENNTFVLTNKDNVQLGLFKSEAKPATSDNPAASDKPGTSDNPGVSDKPGTSDNPGVSDKPGTSDNPPVSEPVTGNKFTVKFVDWDGKELDSQEVEEGKAATAPADPTRENWVFVGWDSDFTNVTADMTVTAKYQKLGDVNADDVVDSADATIILRHSVQAVTLEGVALECADTNKDEAVDAADATVVLRHAVGAEVIDYGEEAK